MAKLAASEAATYISHQVRGQLEGRRCLRLTVLVVCSVFKMFAPSASVHPGPGRDGLRDGHARREALPRRPHHRNLRRHQRDSEASHRRPAAEGVPGVDTWGTLVRYGF